MIQVVYILAFIWFFWFNEVLYIKAHYMEYINKFQGKIKLVQKFCKTHQEKSK